VLHRREHSTIGRRHGPAGSDATVTVEKALNYTWDERKTTRQLQDRIAGFRKRDDECSEPWRLGGVGSRGVLGRRRVGPSIR
jgi:hypothetical protein